MSEMWYEIEHSRIGADDWFSTHDMAHTVERAQKLLEGYIAMRGDEDLQWRIVRKTVTTEVQA